MKTNEIVVVALVAIFAFIGAFAASFMVPCASAYNPPQEDGTGPYRDYTMKVAPIEQTIVTEGTLFFKVQCGHNLFSKVVTIQKLEQVNPGYGAVPNGRVAADEVTANFAPVGGARDFAVLPDGTFDTQLPAGIYSATLNDGNGGQPEVILFAIKPAYSLVITAIGHAVSGVEEQAIRKVTVTSAYYGKIIKVIDSPAVPGVPGTPAVTHQDYEAGHVHAKKVGSHSPHDFLYHGDKYQIVGSSHEAAFMVSHYFYARPACMVTIIDVPAVPAIPAQPEVSHFEGSIVDVTAQVQATVDAGVFTFTFNNARHPGGIFSGDDLVAQIDDPAVGIVKDVVITADGVTINAQEYEVISL